MNKFDFPKITKPAFTTDLQVRIYDINYGNHLGHDSLVSLIHEARMRFLRQHGFTEINVGGVGILVTNLLVNYKAEAFYADNIEIDIAVEEASKTSLDFHYLVKLKVSGRVIANAITTVTFYDYKKGKVLRVPGVIRDLMKQLSFPF